MRFLHRYLLFITFHSLKQSHSSFKNNWGRTDRRTYTVSFKDALSHLKRDDLSSYSLGPLYRRLIRRASFWASAFFSIIIIILPSVFITTFPVHFAIIAHSFFFVSNRLFTIKTLVQLSSAAEVRYGIDLISVKSNHICGGVSLFCRLTKAQTDRSTKARTDRKPKGLLNTETSRTEFGHQMRSLANCLRTSLQIVF